MSLRDIDAADELAAGVDSLTIMPIGAAVARGTRFDSWRDQVVERVLALAMARHPRLGAESPAANLPADCAQRILVLLDKPPLVLDTGSGVVKVGFAGDEAPCALFPTVVGRPRANVPMIGLAAKDYYVGEEAESKRGILHLKYPVEHGCVVNWDDAEAVWRHAFLHELRDVWPDAQPILLAEAPLTPKASREKLVDIMFEVFNVPAVYVAGHAALALFGSGRFTGVVLESGFGVTHVVPVFEGVELASAVLRFDIAGRDLSDWMMRLLTNVGHNFRSASDREIANEIKERLCYVALDFEAEMRTEPSVLEKAYELPAGAMILVRTERFQCPEALFQPHLLGLSMPGVVDLLFHSIMKCDDGIRDELYGNVVLSGGSTHFPGFAERVAKDLVSLAPQSMSEKIHVVAPPDKHGAWTGASRIASLPQFEQSWITREMYQREGAGVVHRMCP